MALGTPLYRTTLDTAATIGPTSGIVAGVTKLGAVAAGQGDQLGIINNIIQLLVALETKVGVDNSTDPTSLDARIKPPNDIQTFTTPGSFTWIKPAVGTPIECDIFCIGGGGAGGSGAYAAANVAASGGSGGAGAGYSRITVPATGLTSTVPGNVGLGLAGGAAQISLGAAGISGTTRVPSVNDTWFGTASQAGINICYAAGGNSGGGGLLSATATGAAGDSVPNALLSGCTGGFGGINGAVGSDGTIQAISAFTGGAGGGGGGGSFTTNATEHAGGKGSGLPAWLAIDGAGAAGAVHASGSSGSSAPFSSSLPGAGGGGGGSSSTSAVRGGSGGNGGNYGGGGGGGAAAQSPSTGSGSGGNGSNGICIVITRF